MQILTKAEFLHCPNGTVFAEWTVDRFTSQIKIKHKRYDESKYSLIDGRYWNGELSLEPDVEYECGQIYTNWSTCDGSDVDYDENQLFAVFSQSEVMQLINCLTWALTGCKGHLDQGLCFDMYGSEA